MSDWEGWKDGHGGLFKNDKKGNENRPDYKGECTVGGRKWEISTWLKDKKDGDGKWMSLSFQEPYVKPEAKTVPQAANDPVPDFEDDIPF